MEKLKKYLPLAIAVSLSVACWGEFILCFVRGYEELWYTLLVPSVIVTALAAWGYLTAFRWLYFIATAVIIAGAILLIGFPSYVLFLGLILGGLSLIGEILMLVVYILNKRSDG